MPDNWKNRSEGMRCKTCMWFVPKKANIIPAYREQMTALEWVENQKGRSFDLGRCRRHAPTMSGWPVMFVNDWCGDHKLDENKIVFTTDWCGDERFQEKPPSPPRPWCRS
jgi:hypothetical protein